MEVRPIFLCLSLAASVSALSINSPNPYITVMENTHLDTVIYTFTVDGTSATTITSKTDAVGVDYTRDDSTGIFTVNVLLKTELDYDYGAPEYSLLFEAKDGGNVAEKGLLLVVQNENDVVPVFIDQPYTVNVLENTAINSIVYDKINPYDIDTNDATTVTISPTDGPFRLRLNGQQDVLELVEELDYETRQVYQYTVTVTDNAQHSSTALVIITVQDVQDTPPQFSKDSYAFTIAENAAQGTALPTSITAEDGDRGVPNDIGLSIKSETCPDLVELDSTSGQLTLKTSPDRDSGSISLQDGVCTLTIEAKEDDSTQDTSMITSAVDVTITITDENDNGPLFSQSNYIGSVEENTAQGVPITISGAINVEDKDQGANAKFTIKIVDPVGVFEVTPSSVQSSSEIQIKVLDSAGIDYEKKTSLVVKLEATDDSNSQFVSTAQVNLTIINVNDESPEFGSKSYEAIIQEGSLPGTHILNIQATDSDAEDSNNFNKIVYSFDSTPEFFTIDNVTGEVTVLNEGLDRETQDLYILTLIAEDGGGIKVSTSLTIRVGDENDNDPKIVSASYQTSLFENSTELQNPVQVQATDADESGTVNSTIEYSLTASSPDGLLTYFSINETDGTFSVVKPLLYEKITFLETQPGKIEITVTASDKGSPPCTANVPVFVTLEDINNNSPRCQNPDSTVTVPENKEGYEALQVNATDEDGSDPNNRIMYSLDQKSSEKFTISSDGMIKTRSGLDYESAKEHEIIVTVTDFGSPSLSGTCSMTVKVSDVNDFSPKFDKEEYVVEIKENGKLTYRECSASDPDETANLQYKIDDSVIDATLQSNIFSSPKSKEFNSVEQTKCGSKKGEMYKGGHGQRERKKTEQLRKKNEREEKKDSDS